MGNDPWSVPTLEALHDADDVDVVLVVTNPPRPAGRGSALTPTAVSLAARASHLDLLEVDGLGSGGAEQAIERPAPDVIAVVAYGELLGERVLGMPPLGTVNLHFSLLPRWRGAAPVQRAILEGDEVTGVSVMLLDAGLDTGPVLAGLEVPIEADDDAGSLGERLAVVGAPLVVDVIRSLEAGTAVPAPQDDLVATYAAKIRPEERAIGWDHPAESIAWRVRGLAPSPGATTTFRNTRLKVLAAQPRPADSPEDPVNLGEVRTDRDGVPVVTAAGGTVALLEVAPAGRSRMGGAEWARGARLRPGERFE